MRKGFQGAHGDLRLRSSVKKKKKKWDDKVKVKVITHQVEYSSRGR